MAKSAAMCPGRDSNPHGARKSKSRRVAAYENPHGCLTCQLINRECSKCELKRLRAERAELKRFAARISRSSKAELPQVVAELTARLAA